MDSQPRLGPDEAQRGMDVGPPVVVEGAEAVEDGRLGVDRSRQGLLGRGRDHASGHRLGRPFDRGHGVRAPAHAVAVARDGGDGGRAQVDSSTGDDERAGVVGQVGLGAPLPQVDGEGLLGPQPGRRRPVDRRRRRVVGQQPIHGPDEGLRPGGHVRRARRAQLRRCAPGPEDQADEQADGAADGDVDHARLTRLPARGLEQAEEHDDEHGERCLTDDEAHRGRRVRGQEGDHREGDPQQRAVFTDRHEHASGHEADERAGHGLQHREAGPEGVRAQRGQRAEPDPERVGQIAGHGDPDGHAEAEADAQGVLEQHRVRPQVRTDGRDHPRRHRGARRRREHRRAACAVVVLAAQRERGVDHRQRDVGDDARGELAVRQRHDLLGRATRVQVGADVAAQVVQLGIARRDERSGIRRRSTVEGVGARPQRIGRDREQLAPSRRDRRARPGTAQVGQPGQPVDQVEEGAVVTGRSGGPEGGGPQVVVQPIGRGPGLGERRVELACSRARRGGAQQRGE